jgi:uncharacterized protein HemY
MDFGAARIARVHGFAMGDDHALELKVDSIARKSPSDPRPLIALGWCLRSREKYAEALPYLEEGLRLKPHYGEADARIMLAEVYERLGEIDKAAAFWRQVIGMKPMYPSREQPPRGRERCAKRGQSNI